MGATLRRRETECVSNCCKIRGRQMFRNPMRWNTRRHSNKQTKLSSLFGFSPEDYSVGHGPGEEACAWLLQRKAPEHVGEMDEFCWISAVLPIASLPLSHTQVKGALWWLHLFGWYPTATYWVVVDGKNPCASSTYQILTQRRREECVEDNIVGIWIIKPWHSLQDTMFASLPSSQLSAPFGLPE